MLNFCDFIQVYVFSTNHHLNSLFGLDNIGDMIIKVHVNVSVNAVTPFLPGNP